MSVNRSPRRSEKEKLASSSNFRSQFTFRPNLQPMHSLILSDDEEVSLIQSKREDQLAPLSSASEFSWGYSVNEKDDGSFGQASPDPLHHDWRPEKKPQSKRHKFKVPKNLGKNSKS